ncbi:MAG: ABC transporter ATP-binding protein, partial [Actinobacteria bacterium]|nr:ABC transporter ATP-binding protein [Actinomycetota bacterium]
ENIFFYGTILGFKKNEIESRVNEIIKFADIGEFIDQPVKTYSGGMFVRLAFAVQTSLKPDILLVDEVLSVGDIFFQQKCHGRIEELMSQGTALVLVSHDMQTIEKYSSKTILLNYGKCITIGLPNQVVNEYYQIDKNKLNVRNLNLNQGINRSQISSSNPTPIMKWPDNENFIIPSHAKNISSAICTGIALCNSEDEICTNFKVGDTAYIFYEIKLLRDIEYPYGMVTIINSKNIVIHAKDTLQYFDNNSSNIPYKNGDILKFMQSFCLSIAEGDYTISLGFGHIKHDDINAVKSSDYSKRNLYMESLLGIVNIIKFSVKADNGQIGFPFHGYVDLKGTFLQFD